MNDKNGGNNEDGEDNYDENNRDVKAEGIGSYPTKRMNLIKQWEGKSYFKLDNLHQCMSSTTLEKLNPVNLHL